MKKGLKLFALTLLFFALVTFWGVDFNKIYSLPEKTYVSLSDISLLNKQKAFGEITYITLSDLEVNADKTKKAKMWVKLFGFIPIKQIEVEVLTDGIDVFLGGVPLGFALKTKGLLVVGDNTVIENNQPQTVNASIKIKNGDYLTKINGQDLETSDDVPRILENLSQNQTVTLTFYRDGEMFECEATPKFDQASGELKLGLWVKNDANGIGTLTFINQETNRFGALGHSITDYETGVKIALDSGKIYKCNQVGITKAEKNTPGELRCVFLQGINTKGTVDKNCDCGVFGNITDTSGLVDFNKTAEIGSRLTVKNGKATILSAVSGVVEEYEIEIIKTYFQPENDDKSFVFRVTDKRLLELTGGIVQGMSGSPILQNGKLIGATTHVFVADPSKGYGIYADWMANQ